MEPTVTLQEVNSTDEQSQEENRSLHQRKQSLPKKTEVSREVDHYFESKEESKDKIFHDLHIELEAKKQMLQTQLMSRLKKVDALRQKLINRMDEKIKCQQQYDEQCIDVIHRTQAAFRTRLTSCQQSLPTGNKTSRTRQTAVGSLEKDQLNESEREKEELAKTLEASTKNRLNALNEAVTSLTLELESTETECLSIDKELFSTTKLLSKISEALNIHVDDDDTNISSDSSFQSVDEVHDLSTRSSSKSVRKSETSMREIFAKHACVRLEKLPHQPENISHPTPAQRKFAREPSLSSWQENLESDLPSTDVRSSSDRSSSAGYESPEEKEKTIKKTKSPEMPPRKRGRPRKQQPNASISLEESGRVPKRGRGRPPKYLKINVDPQPSANE